MLVMPLRLTADMYAAVAERAVAERTSRVELVREAIKSFLIPAPVSVLAVVWMDEFPAEVDSLWTVDAALDAGRRRDKLNASSGGWRVMPWVLMTAVPPAEPGDAPDA